MGWFRRHFDTDAMVRDIIVVRRKSRPGMYKLITYIIDGLFFMSVVAGIIITAISIFWAVTQQTLEIGVGIWALPCCLIALFLSWLDRYWWVAIKGNELRGYKGRKH